MAYKDNVYSGAPKTTVRNENLLFVHCSPTVVVLFFTLGHWPIFHAKHWKDILGGNLKPWVNVINYKSFHKVNKFLESTTSDNDCCYTGLL